MINRISTIATRQAAKQLGAHLRALRRQQRWTQSYAGEVIGVDPVTVRRWELGTFSPAGVNLERVAAAYGVQVTDLLQFATDPSSESLVVAIPIRGYVEAGVPRDSYEVDLGVLPLPRQFIEGHPNAFSLIATGDSLVLDGIHNEDILVVDPDHPARAGGMCIVRIDQTLCATMFISSNLLRFRTPSGSSENLDPSTYPIMGSVVWHFRRM